MRIQGFAAPFLLCALLSGLNPVSAAESWMNERERANSVQRDLERLADQARTPNSQGGTVGVDAGAAARAASEAEAAARGQAEAQRQRNAQEADDLRSQRRQALEAQFREIDRASASLADQMYRRDVARFAAAQPLLKEGPNADNLTEYCEGMLIFVEAFFTRSGMGDPVRAIKSYEAALAVDETHQGCWRGYGQISTAVSRNPEQKHRYFDYASLGIPARDQVQTGRAIDWRYQQFRKLAMRRQAAVETFVNPAVRIAPPPATPPERFAKWSKLRKTDDPEALYWLSRVHRLGLLDQPVNLEAAREVTCRPEAAGYFRNRVNCWVMSNPVADKPALEQLASILDSLKEDPRNPAYYSDNPTALAEILRNRSDRAVALSIGGGGYFDLVGRIQRGESPLPYFASSLEENVKELMQRGCTKMEEAVSLGYYDNGADVANLMRCYEMGTIQAPTGGRSKVLSALERDGNTALQKHREATTPAVNTEAAVVPVDG